MKDKYDVIIIGSGIAGMTAAIYLKRGGVNPLIIEENAPGGQLNKINIIEKERGIYAPFFYLTVVFYFYSV